MYKHTAPHAVPTPVCQGPSFYLKGLVMMSKQSRFGVDTFIGVMAYIKIDFTFDKKAKFKRSITPKILLLE